MRRKNITPEISIGDKYKLSADSLNIILQEKSVTKKTGKEYWVNIAYFSSWENALEWVVDKDIREAWVKDLEYVVKEVARLEKMIEGLRSKPLPELS